MKIKTTGPVELDGKKVRVGTTLNVSETTADQLVGAGAAELVTAKGADAAAAGDDKEAD